MDEKERQNRDKALEERIEALDWCLENIDQIEDRLVKAYVIKLKRLIDEEERRLQQAEEAVHVCPTCSSIKVVG